MKSFFFCFPVLKSRNKKDKEKKKERRRRRRRNWRGKSIDICGLKH